MREGTPMNIEVMHTAGRGKGRIRVAENMPKLNALLSAQPYPGTFNVVLDHPVQLVNAFILDHRRDRVGVQAFINGLPCIAYRFRGAPLHVFELISEFKLSDAVQSKNLTLVIPDNHLARPSLIRKIIWRLYYGRNPQAYYDDRIFQNFKFRDSVHKMATQRRF